VKEITAENYKGLDHVPTEDVKWDIEIIDKENKDYRDEKDILMRNPQQNRTRIYMLEGKISANDQQKEQLLKLLKFREDERVTS
jgi:hypothetical protein